MKYMKLTTFKLNNFRFRIEFI